MASYTPNYNLKKPAGTDVVDIDDLNGNMDIIDTQLDSLNSNIANIRPSTVQRKWYYTSGSFPSPKSDVFDNDSFVYIRGQSGQSSALEITISISALYGTFSTNAAILHADAGYKNQMVMLFVPKGSTLLVTGTAWAIDALYVEVFR